MITIGIDQSKRSTAVVSLMDGELLSYKLVSPPKDIDMEKLIHYQWTMIQSFITDMVVLLELLESTEGIQIALEGAAFKAGGSSSDLLWGIQWYIRTRIFAEFPNIPIGIVTPATWRKSIVPIEIQRAAKVEYNGKIGLKHAVVDALPSSVLHTLTQYLEECRVDILAAKGLEAKSKSRVYKDSLFDLADAWGIARHRWLLSSPKTQTKAKPKVPQMSALKRRFPNADTTR